MKSNSKFLPALAALCLLALTGCDTTQVPSSYASGGSNPAMAADFDGNSLAVNPQLAEANRPGNVVQVPGSAAGSGATPTLVSPGAVNTAYAVRMAGTVVDPGDGSYPSILLQMPLDKAGNQYYDASLFSGVRFYLKIAGDDTAGKKYFSIPIAQTEPPSSGGNCDPNATSNACYNDFAFIVTSTGGNWEQMTIPFSSFTRGAYGSAISPTTLSGTNLQQVLMLEWGESNNNVAGTINVDFYVDQVQFY
jgi:hypothetical protein